jgi:hypothetical protein
MKILVCLSALLALPASATPILSLPSAAPAPPSAQMAWEPSWSVETPLRSVHVLPLRMVADDYVVVPGMAASPQAAVTEPAGALLLAAGLGALALARRRT